MVHQKRKAVVNALADHVDRVEGLVDAGIYSSVSEFVREAMAEKLARLEQERLARQVAQYCAVEDHDDDLIAAQAFDAEG